MKTVFITGANGALGRAIALDLKKDHRVIVSAATQQNAVEAARATGCDSVPCDITSWQSVSDAVSEIHEDYGPISIVINCAGLYTNGPVDEVDPDRAAQVINVNTLGPILLAKAVTPQMKANHDGCLIFINSIGGVTSKQDRSVYYGSKWGLTGITKSLQLELSPWNIKVSGLYPAALQQRMNSPGEDGKRDKAVGHGDLIAAIRFILSRPSNVLIDEIGMRDLDYLSNS